MRVALIWLCVPLLGAGCVSRLIVEVDAEGGQSDGREAGDETTAADETTADETTAGDESSAPPADSGTAPPPVQRGKIYVNSSDTLFTFDPDTISLARVGPFVLEDGSGASVTDIAIDSAGLLYAVSSGGLYVCDPQSVACTPLGTTTANSAGFAEFGALDPSDDVLVLVEGSDVVHVAVRADGTETSRIGSLSPYASSGDVMPWGGSRMLLSSPAGGDGDVLVVFDAATAEILEVGARIPALSYGLAGHDDEVWVFTDLGEVMRVSAAGEVVEEARAQERFWGAATHPDSR